MLLVPNLHSFSRIPERMEKGVFNQPILPKSNTQSRRTHSNQSISRCSPSPLQINLERDSQELSISSQPVSQKRKLRYPSASLSPQKSFKHRQNETETNRNKRSMEDLVDNLQAISTQPHFQGPEIPKNFTSAKKHLNANLGCSGKYFQENESQSCVLVGERQILQFKPSKIMVSLLGHSGHTVDLLL